MQTVVIMCYLVNNDKKGLHSFRTDVTCSKYVVHTSNNITLLLNISELQLIKCEDLEPKDAEGQLWKSLLKSETFKMHTFK